MEPWMSGNARGASTAFCILYRILAMENVPHFKVNKMIYHQDSVYIRCIGLLYARYKFYNDEENLMKFFSEDVFKDKKEISFAPSVDGKKLTSFSQFAIDLICSQEYFETLFPRIPEVLKRKMQAKIESWLDGGKKVEAKGGGGIGEWRRSKGDGKGRVMSVKESLSVNVGQRAPHLANARERGRSGFDPESSASRGGFGGGGGGYRTKYSSSSGRGSFYHQRDDRGGERGGGNRRRDGSRDRYENNDYGSRGGVRGGGARRRNDSDDDNYYDDDYYGRRGGERGGKGRGEESRRELPYATRELPYKR